MLNVKDENISNEEANVNPFSMNYVLNEDFGNDKMKVLEPGLKDIIKIPSVFKRVTKVPNVQETDMNKNVVNLLDQLVVNITSYAIKHSGLYLIGEKALKSSKDVRNMNIEIENKHTSDVPLINTLGFVAARAVQKAYKKENQLPKVIHVKTYMASAIPASQHNIDTAKYLEDRFTENEHVVIVYVGKETVTVQIKFERVKITKEGVPALYAIFEGPKEIFKEFNEEYRKEDEEPITGEDFTINKMMHVDIGSGTTEYIYTVGVNPSPDQCTGERHGVGHAINAAIEMMEEERKGLNISRQQFSKYIEHPDEYSKDSDLIKESLQEGCINQVDSIMQDVKEKYINTMQSEPEIIAVYGGGSIVFKEEMYEELKGFAHEQGAKILWIPKEFAVDMNVRGLDILSRDILFEKEYQEMLNQVVD